MDPAPNGQHRVQKGDKGIRALDIVRYQFPSVKAEKHSEYLRQYKKAGLELPTANLPGSGKGCNREFEQPVVTTREELDKLLTRFKDQGKRFLDQYQQEIEQWFPTSTSGRNGSTPLPTCCSQLRNLVIMPHDHSVHATLPNWAAAQTFISDLELETGSTYSCARQQEDKPGVLTREYRCTFGGKPSWLVRAKRANADLSHFTRANAGVSKKCGCPAVLTCRMPAAHAKEEGLYRANDAANAQERTNPEPSVPNEAPTHAPTNEQAAAVEPGGGAYGDASETTEPSAVDTTIRLHLHLQHEGHNPLSNLSLIIQPPHPKVREKAVDLSRNGYKFKQLQPLLTTYADELVSSLGIQRNPLDARFYPRPWTIRNLYYATLRQFRAHKVDQMACEAELRAFELMHPGARTLFRKRSGNDKMLMVLQTPEQQSMLRLYGNHIVGMDATYKTSKWGFPLFLLDVIDNHDHGYPVALFFVEAETGDMIGEALQVLREWNPTWRPKHFMVDKSDAEQNAITTVFDTDTRVLLCDFHRLQAWLRWIDKSSHNVKTADKEPLYKALYNLGYASTIESFNAQLAALKQSRWWTGNPLLAQYLESEWLGKEVVKWAACYRQAYHGAIDTNNHLEAMNRVFKSKWLSERPDERMDSLLRKYSEKIVTHYANSYTADNTFSLLRTALVTRETPLPTFAAGRPQPTVDELKKRHKKGLAILAGVVQEVDGARGVYQLHKSDDTLALMKHVEEQEGGVPVGAPLQLYLNGLSSEDRYYTINISAGTCTCGDFETHRIPCKHMFAVMAHTRWTWLDLPVADELRLPASMKGRQHVERVVDGLAGREGPWREGPALEWGNTHEPNCDWMLLKHLKEIPGFGKATSWLLKEQGFIELASGEGRPPMGASPDGLLEVDSRSGRQEQKRQVLVEYKARFPYLPAGQGENTSGAEESYKFAPFIKFPANVPATHFAQVHLGMLATCTLECIYMQYSVEKTEVRMIPFSSEWAAAMETWVKRFWAAHYSRQEVQPVNFGHNMDADEYSAFLALTRRLCESAPVVKVLTSVEGYDRRVFL